MRGPLKKRPEEKGAMIKMSNNDIDDFVKQITKKNENFSKWYIEIIKKAEMADYSPMKGVMVIRPYGYEIWELIQKYIKVFHGFIPLINVVILFVIYMMRVILLSYVAEEYIHMM